MEATCVWPMEYIKTQLQLQERLPAGEKPKFTGMISGKYGVIMLGEQHHLSFEEETKIIPAGLRIRREILWKMRLRDGACGA